ncbi:recombinase family protein [Glaciihabitans sp. UYNi722]|uniref:recombinase family protein n=1 Tax=Glaciihabitans sp. UYNi722 TaxID=3156344 RepID=UPI0033917530
MTRVGYLWVGPLEHNAEFQRDLLTKRGVDTIFEDISAHVATPIRTELTAALDHIGDGDTLVVWRLDRLGSTSPNVLSLLELLGRRGVGVTSIAEEMDTSGDEGNALLTIISAFNELERCLIRERTMVGVYAARARGRVAGRPRALSPTNVERVLMLKEQGATVREISQELGTSRATVYRALETASLDPDGALADSDERTSLTVRFATPSLGDSDPLAMGER